LITADPKTLELVERAVAELDMPRESPLRTEIRAYPIDALAEEETADSIRDVFSRSPGFAIESLKGTLMVRATSADHRRLADLLEKQRRSAELVSKVFPVGNADPKRIGEYLETLFERQPKQSRPKVAAAQEDRCIVVRGTREQVDDVAALLKGLIRATPVVRN
jgi:type II secretory pathway component GspD/PulD (secretin)